MVEINDILKSLVNMLREEVVITNITALTEANTYNISISETPQLLTVGQTIQFETHTAVVITIANNVLKVKATGDISTETSFTLKAPYYMIGYWAEIANEISEFGKSKILENQKFPLVVVNSLDVKDRYNTLYDGELDLDFYVITESENILTTSERFDLAFKNTLNPIAMALIDAIKLSNYFTVDGKKSLGNIDHEIKFYPYLGSEAKSQNKINDVVDALLIKVKSLKINKCLTLVETI